VVDRRSDFDADRLLTPAEAADIFRVEPKTASRWADEGLIKYVRTLGGHRRFPEAEVLRLLRRGSDESWRTSREPAPNRDGLDDG